MINALGLRKIRRGPQKLNQPLCELPQRSDLTKTSPIKLNHQNPVAKEFSVEVRIICKLRNAVAEGYSAGVQLINQG